MTLRDKVSSIVLGFAIAYCIAILIILLNITRNDLVIKVYYFLDIICLLLFVSALKFRTENRLRLILIIVSTGITVYFVELCLFMLDNVDRPAIANKRGIYFDERSRNEVINDLKKSNIDACPDISTTLLLKTNGLRSNKGRIFTFGGLSNKTTVLCNECGEWIIYTTDEHGFNNPGGLYKKGNIDIALPGDSFALGWCVKPSENIAGLLRMTGKKVLNLGVTGASALTMLAVIREYVEPLEPKIVLWTYFEGNDITGLVNERTSKLLMSYLDRDFKQDLLSRQEEIDSLLASLIKSTKQEQISLKSRFLNSNYGEVFRLLHLRNRFFYIKYFFKRVHKDTFPMYEKILVEAVNRVKSWGGNLYFVYLPTWQRYNRDHKNGDYLMRNEMLSLVGRLGIDLIDIHQAMMKHSDPLSLFALGVPGHYSAEGHRLTARQIEAHLLSKGF